MTIFLWCGVNLYNGINAKIHGRYIISPCTMVFIFITTKDKGWLVTFLFYVAKVHSNLHHWWHRVVDSRDGIGIHRALYCFPLRFAADCRE